MDLSGPDAYGFDAFVAGVIASCVTFLAAMVVFAVLLCCSKRCEMRVTAFFAGILASFSQMCTTVLLAWVSGFGYIPPWLAFLTAALLWIPVVAFCMVLIGPSWRTIFLIAAVASKDEDGSLGKRSQRRWLRIPLSVTRAMILVTLKTPVIFWVSTVFAFIFSLVVVIALEGVCFCLHPTSLSTWASRRAETHYCSTNEMCHVYAMLGAVPSSLRIVSHIVTSGDPPVSGWVTVCESSVLNACGGGPLWSNASIIWSHNQISEDQRFIGHTLLSNLTPSTAYLFTAYFTLTDGTVVHRSIRSQTVPALDSDEDVVLIGGGDYQTDDAGIEMLRALILESPDAQVLYFGGDLSYGNNMRTCYLRWDAFLHAVTSLVTAAGLNLPLLTVNGNHESEGYLVVPPSGIYFYPFYFPQYEGPLDTLQEIYSRMYHTHLLGSQLGVVALDSNIVIEAIEEQPYLEQQLRMIRGVPANETNISDAQFAAMRFALVMYHNAVFGGSNAGPSFPVSAMKSYITPTIAAHHVPLVLEFHEHVFTRTYPLDESGNNVGGTASGGTVYIGDGSMGVWSPSRQLGNFPYVAKALATNCANVIRVFANGTAMVVTVNDGGGGSSTAPIVTIDATSITKRR